MHHLCAANNVSVCHTMAGAELSQEMALSRRPNGQRGVFANQLGLIAALQNNPIPTEIKAARTRHQLSVMFDNGRSYAVQTKILMTGGASVFLIEIR